MNYIAKTTILFLSTFILFSACKKDDPIYEDENELIQLVKIEFTDSSTQETYTWKDGKSDTIQLTRNQEYAVLVSFYNLDKNQNEINITDEIIEDSDAHQVFYTSEPSSSLSVTYEDKDDRDFPIGIQTSMTTSNSAQEGKLRIVLKHYSDKKDGLSTSGSTDIDVKFVVNIQ